VFLSWSGERSKVVAIALRQWLPLVLHFVKPWLSDRDIASGDRWAIEIGEQLQDTQFGIVCLTPDNLHAEWILFEAGALSKSLSEGAVVPYLFDLDFSSLRGPLAQFQGRKSDRESTFALLQDINQRASDRVDAERLKTLFAALWPQLDEALGKVPASAGVQTAKPTEAEILEQVVETVRGLDHRFLSLEARVTQSIDSAMLALDKSSRSTHSDDFPGLAHRRKEYRISSDVVAGEFSPDQPIAFLSYPERAARDIAWMAKLPQSKLGESWWLRDEVTGETLDADRLRRASLASRNVMRLRLQTNGQEESKEE